MHSRLFWLALLFLCSCDCLGKAVDRVRGGVGPSADAGLDVSTPQRVLLDFKKLREERSLSDFLGVYLKYHQLVNARLMRFDDTMCKSKNDELLDATKELAESLKKDPRGTLQKAKRELEAPPLHLAALLCQPEVMSLLLDHGAELRATDAHGFTALHWVSCLPAAKVLLAAGSDVRAKSKEGLTPLHLAVDRPLVRAFIAAGADLEAQDKCGNRPLHAASWFGLSFPPVPDGGLAAEVGLPVAKPPPFLRALGFAVDRLGEVLQLLSDRFDVVGELRAAGADASAVNSGGNQPHAGGGGGWDD